MIDFFAIGDPVFGDDFHSFSATQMFRIIYNAPELIINKRDYPDERDKAKNIVFKMNYGGSAYTLAKDLGITEEEAEKYVANYFKGLPGMEESFKNKKQFAIENGYIVLSEVTQARYFYPYFKDMQKLQEKAWSYFPDDYKTLSNTEREKVKASIKHLTSPIWKKYFYYKSKLERRSLNFPIQGAAAQMMKLAIIYLYNYRWSNQIQDEVFVNNSIHDECNSECIEELAESYAKVVEKAMIKAGSIICNKVPFKADAVISDHWQH